MLFSCQCTARQFLTLSRRRYRDESLPLPRCNYSGLDGPFFPSSLDELNHTYARVAVNGFHLTAIARLLSGCPMTSAPVSHDGYAWFWAASFSKIGSSVLVAFPWAQDEQYLDGTTSDRSIAIYMQGLNGDWVDCLITDLVRAIAHRLKFWE